MASRSISLETLIDADVDAVWAATQDTRQHVRWDVRFSEIVPEPADTDGAARFTYVRRSALHDVHGTGISIGERLRDDGTRTSALRFATDDRLSPIRTGRGYWRYVPTDDGRTRFITGYDYDSGWGPLDLVVRPLLGWATAWSFDRLRVWLEGGPNRRPGRPPAPSRCGAGTGHGPPGRAAHRSAGPVEPTPCGTPRRPW
ncbi:SRPBCC family protein [Curtobacterium sp. MCBD17_030]|uniref:SRPBCC family protein n=1 Tax=Curtobacterium sp. MCBD17_030 TaxID=2175649 RepID=UPI001C651994|nr:SRPBCC family protein [Curtobacterium sp. MCBD17_030]